LPAPPQLLLRVHEEIRAHFSEFLPEKPICRFYRILAFEQ
jgi:hypothetical protein